MISYEEEVKERIMYYYCLALARNKSCDFEKEVLYFNSDEHYIMYHFLKGYHYRVLGNFSMAEKSYQNVLRRNPRDMKTRRELVFIYVSNQEYEMAIDLAKENYKQNKNNIHYMQAYFDCLIYKRNKTEKEMKDLREIVDIVKTIYQSIRVNSMYYQILAKNEAFVEHNKELAIKYINEGISKNKNSIISYLLKERFDIYEYFKDIEGMEDSISQLKQELNKLEIDDVRMNNILVGREALLDAYKGKKRTSIQMSINQNKYLTDSGKAKIMSNVDKILNGQNIFYDV